MGDVTSTERLLSSNGDVVRLSKRMSELNICSRREADLLLREGKVAVGGITAQLGQKVACDEKDITVFGGSIIDGIAAVVLNKPSGYVSGQPEKGQVPAVRLLTRKNAFPEGCDSTTFIQHSSYFDRTLHSFVPAGRLDMESCGLLVFCASGVLAKKFVSSLGVLEKDYFVEVEMAQQLTKRERTLGMKKLPRPSFDLSLFHSGGAVLVGDHHPLRPAQARWECKGESLQITLNQGRKHQIRRMCREILGHHVIKLQRTRIGPIELGDLPEGKWRPVADEEVRLIWGMDRQNDR